MMNLVNFINQQKIFLPTPKKINLKIEYFKYL